MHRTAMILAAFLALVGPMPAWSAFKLEDAPEQRPQPAPAPPRQQQPQPRPPKRQRSEVPPAERAQPDHPLPDRTQPERPQAAPASPERPAPERERAPAETATPGAPDELRRNNSAAASDSEGWAVDARSRCKVWVGETRPGETVNYAGRCANGVASGEGELQRRSGEQVIVMYQGTFTNGRLTGPGVRIAANGDRLEAPFVEGRASGQGVLRYHGSYTDRYEGVFRDDQPNGQGTRFWPDGARYEGEWLNGVRSGLGQQLFRDGARYAGAWRADRPNGRGAMQYANGDIYDGEWVDGRRSGRGTLRWFAPGQSGVYDGQWRDDLRNGYGRETFARENATYEGTFVNDRPQGHGIYVLGPDRYEGDVRDGCIRSGWRTIPVGPTFGTCQ